MALREEAESAAAAAVEAELAAAGEPAAAAATEAAQGGQPFDPVAYINTPRWQKVSLGLERTRLLLDLLGRPQDALAFVHVAGTNGKGSTCAYLASILQQAGYRTGLFTSPYIMQFHERIRVDGENISDASLLQATLRVRSAAAEVEQRLGEHPTEFELMTAVALLHFASQGCQLVVLEVGLGGRLDSTNVIQNPQVCVITRLGLDHTAVLGSTLAQIAAEKAGIVKPGCPVASYPQPLEAAQVIEDACGTAGAPLVVADFSRLQVEEVDRTGAVPVRPFTYGAWGRLTTRLLGSYQPENAALALEAVALLRERGWNIPDAAVRSGIAATQWPGRFEVVGTNPVFVVDGGHNPQGAAALVASLNSVFPGRKPVFLMGVLADKDYPAMVREVLPLADCFVLYTPPNPRALGAAQLAQCIQAQCCAACGNPHDGSVITQCNAVPTKVVASAEEGVRYARMLAGESGLVVAFGSLYSIAGIKEALAAQGVCS